MYNDSGIIRNKEHLPVFPVLTIRGNLKRSNSFSDEKVIGSNLKYLTISVEKTSECGLKILLNILFRELRSDICYVSLSYVPEKIYKSIAENNESLFDWAPNATCDGE